MIEGRRFIARAEDPQTALPPVPLGARHELDAVSELSEARAADQCVTVRGEGAADIVADGPAGLVALLNELAQLSA